MRGAGSFTVAIRVQPGAPRTVVGGSRGEALIVRVTARPVAGAATAAALRAVAAAFGVRPADVTLVSGGTSRDKVVRVEGDPARLAATLGRLRNSG